VKSKYFIASKEELDEPVSKKKRAEKKKYVFQKGLTI